MKCLIAYCTRYGVTRETSNVIAETLKSNFDAEVDIIDLKEEKKRAKSVNPNDYDIVIVGSSIRIGRWTKEAKNFLKSDFKNTHVAIFVSSGRCGQAIEDDDMEEYDKYEQKYIDRIAEKQGLKLFAKRGFGGRMERGGEVQSDTWNRDHIVEWTVEVGKKIEEEMPSA
ncbi:MAG: hypothetical protein BAJATHORv1_10590 [Candidatus Thorarchaeota archaeon]|nr:MAG: hypothetical protein BAJATHORv1_10590 [Candidatus Thorarchaeota archaeon]